MPTLAFIILFALIASLSSSTDVGYFVHISDVHIDTRYKVGTNPSCGKWTCCRDDNTTISSRRLSSSSSTAGMFGTPSSGHCGIPIQTLDGVLDFVRGFPYEGGVKPTAFLFTGDNTVNDCDKARGGCPRSQITDTVDLINSHILAGLWDFCHPPECVVLRSMGNHDGEPTEDTELMPKGAWIVDHFADFHDHYVDAKTASFYREKGYLSLSLGKMKVIAINTQWTSARNDYNKAYPFELKHPMTEFMMDECKDAKENGQNVILIGHIPLAQESSRDYHVWNEEFLHMVREYPDVLKLSLWGHTHQNNFYITRNLGGDPIGFSIVTGSVTNQGERNTVLTMIKYDKQTNEILDIMEYYNDIEQSNRDKSMTNNWHLLRSFKNDFGMEDMSPKSFDGLLSQMKTNQTLYQTILNQRYSNYQSKVVCEGICKKNFLCSIEYTSMVKHDECVLA